MLRLAKRCTKRLFRIFGLDIRRIPSYQPYSWLREVGIQTVLDIGANTGQFAAMIHQVLPEARVYSFEPLRDCYEQLSKNMQGIAGFKGFNFALGDVNGQAEIFHNDFSPSSSLLPMEELHMRAFPFTVHATPEIIEVRRLDEVAKDIEISDNCVIKVDVQGAEDKGIEGGQATLSMASVVVVETSFEVLYTGQALFHTIYDLLRERGLVYMGSEHIIRNPNDGRVLQCDSLFFRRPDRSRQVPYAESD